MNKFMKASIIALSMVLATTAIAAVSAPNSVSAKKKKTVKKIDAEQFKKLTAALDKARAEVKKQQASLVNKLKKSQTGLQNQLKDALVQASTGNPADPSAPATNPPASGGTTTDPAVPASVDPAATSTARTAAVDTAAPTASVVPADPAAPASTTPPADGTQPAPGTPYYEADATFVDVLNKLADEDDSFSKLFSPKQLDKVSSLAERWLANDKQLDKAAQFGAKLVAAYEAAVKSNNFAEALKIQTQQLELDKEVNKTYGSMLTAEHLVSVAVEQAVAPEKEDKKDKKSKKHNKGHIDQKEHNHGDDNGDNNDGDNSEQDVGD